MGFPLKCFLDAYKGYHQVHIAEEDEEKTAFYTDQGMYCYTKMSFGLKNAGATYQRLIDGVFQSQIGRNLEAYVDDMVIKSKSERKMLADIAETFDNLKRINMKLNPKRCSFRVEEGKFLGYMVTSKEKSLPFFKTLKDITKENKHDYRWIEKAENAFQELKKMILDLPALTTPLPKETLFVYLAASKEAVSAVMLVVRQGKQHLVHYVIKTLHDAERNYALLEKMALALRHASKRLRRYFEAHPITIITYQPIKQILRKADTLDYKEEWVLYTDRASSTKGSGAGLVLISPTKTEYTYALRLNFKSTNNQAEYEALLAGLKIAKKMGVNFGGNIRRAVNGHRRNKCSSGRGRGNVDDTHHQLYREGNMAEDQNKARALRMKINQYVMEEGVLFKRSYLMPMLRCVGPLQANYVIKEIHMGACSMHLKARSVVAKAIRQGYYWPTMNRD
ncbi:reverse transcriptase domain-containing protein, partial [Tanacetum coccineum]